MESHIKLSDSAIATVEEFTENALKLFKDQRENSASYFFERILFLMVNFEEAKTGVTQLNTLNALFPPDLQFMVKRNDERFSFFNVLCRETYDYLQGHKIPVSPFAKTLLDMLPNIKASLQRKNLAPSLPQPDVGNSKKIDAKKRKQQEAYQQFLRQQEEANKLNQERARQRELDRQKTLERRMPASGPKKAAPLPTTSTTAPIANDPVYETKQTPTPPQTPSKEKTKTKGTPDPEKARKAETTVTSEAPAPALSTSRLKTLGGKHWRTFDKFWTGKVGVKYKRFINMFKYLGGQVEEDGGTSHVTLRFFDHQGVEHTGGTWHLHGTAYAFGYRSTRQLIEFLTECGLTPDNVHYKGDATSDELSSEESLS